MVTRAADYAARVMIYLAALPPRTRVRLTVLASATEVPESFLSKVLQGLVRARLIVSRPGVNGGFELAAPPDQVTLLDIMEAIDGPLQLNVCVANPPGCGRHSWCGAHLVWIEAQDVLTKVLKSATLTKLAQTSNTKRVPLEALGSGKRAVARQTTSAAPPSRSRRRS